MRQLGRLDGIVIDDAHTVFDIEHGWRMMMLGTHKFNCNGDPFGVFDSDITIRQNSIIQ
jgi:hypothetical protein